MKAKKFAAAFWHQSPINQTNQNVKETSHCECSCSRERNKSKVCGWIRNVTRPTCHMRELETWSGQKLNNAHYQKSLNIFFKIKNIHCAQVWQQNKIGFSFEFCLFSWFFCKTGKYFIWPFEETIFCDVYFAQLWMAHKLFIISYLVRNENAGNAFNRCSMYTVHAQKQLLTLLSETRSSNLQQVSTPSFLRK